MNKTAPLRYTVLRSSLGSTRLGNTSLGNTPIGNTQGGYSSTGPSFASSYGPPLTGPNIDPSNSSQKEEDTLKTTFDIHFECRSASHLSEIIQDPDVIAFAPVMPTKLNGVAVENLGEKFDEKSGEKLGKSKDIPQSNNRDGLLRDKHALPKAANSFGFSGSAGRSGINRSGINGLYNALYNQGAATWGIKAVRADRSRYTGEGVRVALLDTGIDSNHEAFYDLNLEEKDFTGEGNGDHDGHGTHCAGTIFGKDVDGNRIGIAPSVDRAIIGKVMGRRGGDSHMLYRGIEWALNSGAKVIAFALSFDFQQFAADLEKQGHQSSAAMTIALDAYCQNMALFDKLMSLIACHEEQNGGALLIAASGNHDFTGSDDLQDNGNLFNAPVTPCLPAAASGVVSVAAVQYKSDRISLANFSTCLPDIVAPGADILSAKAGGGLFQMSGASMACPHAAGVAVLYWEEVTKMGLRPGLWCEVVRDKMASKATYQFFGQLLVSDGDDKSSAYPQHSRMNYGVGLVQAPQ